MRILSLTILPFLAVGMVQQAQAGDPLADEIVKALTGGNKLEERANTRSLSGSVNKGKSDGREYRARSFVTKQPGSLAPTQATRAIQTVEGTLLIQPGANAAAEVDKNPVIQGATTAAATPVVQPPVKLSYDLYVTFPFGSQELDTTAREKLGSVAEALKHPSLSSKIIQIAGHTDSVGSASKNMRLSMGRAEAVKKFLSVTHGIDSARIRTVGYGETRLKDDKNPTAGVNRRVELVNLGNTIASAN